MFIVIYKALVKYFCIQINVYDIHFISLGACYQN
jgi:hypothetical protein